MKNFVCLTKQFPIPYLVTYDFLLQSQCSSQERLHQLGAAAQYHHGTTPAPAGTPIGHVPGSEAAMADPRHFSSNDSNPSLIDDEGRRSPSIRPRSRSLRYGTKDFQDTRQFIFKIEFCEKVVKIFRS